MPHPKQWNHIRTQWLLAQYLLLVEPLITFSLHIAYGHVGIELIYYGLKFRFNILHIIIIALYTVTYCCLLQNVIN